MSEPARIDGDVGSADLAVELRRLSDRIDTLQADVRRLSGPSLPSEPGWQEERDDEGVERHVSHEWLGALEPAIRRRPQVPRLLLEVLFLAACAAGAALADLDGVAILGVMAGAWVLVALIEWAASRAERRRDELLMAPPPAPVPVDPVDPSWFVPPVERTMLDGAEDAGAVTAATRLPPMASGDPDVTIERAPDRD